MSLLAGPTTKEPSLPARIVRSVRPWWPHAMKIEDPVDAALVDWLAPARLVYAGLALIVIVFGGLAVWNGSSELERGAMADATVEPASHRKVVDSRFPGTVRELLVRENEEVRAGQPLIILDSTVAAAVVDLQKHKRFSELARAARLTAIRDDAAQPSWPQELLDAARTDPEIETALALNRKLFDESRQTIAGQLGVLDTQIAQAKQFIASREAARSAFKEQLALIHKELEGVLTLLNQGLERKPKALELQRSEAQLTGQIASTEADIARSEIQVREAELRRESLKADQRERATKELGVAQAAEMEASDMLRAQKFELERQTITAPQSGRVAGLQIHTVGSAIRPGEPLMSIIPSEDSLLLRVAVSPHDISDVVPGTKARVTIEGHSRGLRGLPGVVTSVSPDLVPHPRAPQAQVYVAEVEVHANEISRDSAKNLRPGLAAHVKLITGTRSVWTYMTESLFDALRSHDLMREEHIVE